jgi:hypothetical protein
MVNADMVIGYVDRLGNGFGYMAGMTSTTQASPTIKNPFKPLNAKIGVSSVQEGAQTFDDLEVMEFTIDRALWGNGNPISLLVSYRSADALFDVTKAPYDNPKFREALGHLLDRESMRQVAVLAKEAGAQLWVERVEVDDTTTVLIEDGQVAGGASVPPVAAAG